MLTQLSTVKSRLAILVSDYDDLLTLAIQGLSARFDRECNRTFARTVDATQEFDPADSEILLACYPVESVSKFEIKTSEGEGWVEQTGVQYLIRRQCIVSLAVPFGPEGVPEALGRITYTGAYVLPGETPGPGQRRLPEDVERAVIEQVAFWFQHRDKLGLIRSWPHDGTFEAFAQLDLLLEVKAVLRRHERWVVG